LGDCPFGHWLGHFTLLKVAHDPHFAEPLVVPAGAGKGFRKAFVIQVTVFFQFGEYPIDVTGLSSAANEFGTEFGYRESTHP
jgi:hypothetical protein